MKSKYVVLRESGYDESRRCSKYDRVKTFKNEQDAISFVSDMKNVRMHGELFLECYGSDGNHYEWDVNKNEWVLA